MIEFERLKRASFELRYSILLRYVAKDVFQEQQEQQVSNF